MISNECPTVRFDHQGHAEGLGFVRGETDDARVFLQSLLLLVRCVNLILEQGILVFPRVRIDVNLVSRGFGLLFCMHNEHAISVGLSGLLHHLFLCIFDHDREFRGGAKHSFAGPRAEQLR